MFGAVRSSTGTGSTEYKYTGEQDDATLGYTYLRARYYDQATGRFISKDPFPGFAADPASQHHYSYVQNNPINLTDPSGECPFCIPLFLGALTAWSAYDTVSTLNNPCATPEEKRRGYLQGYLQRV